MEIEQGDDDQENIEVSYSTHLRERENVQKLLEGNTQGLSRDCYSHFGPKFSGWHLIVLMIHKVAI